MGEVIPSWNGDGVFTGRESHTSHRNQMKLFNVIAALAVAASTSTLVSPVQAGEHCSVDGANAPCQVTTWGGRHDVKWINTGKTYSFQTMPGHGSWQQGAVKVTEPNGNIAYGSYVHEGPMRGGTYIVQYKGSTITFTGW